MDPKKSETIEQAEADGVAPSELQNYEQEEGPQVIEQAGEEAGAEAAAEDSE